MTLNIMLTSRSAVYLSGDFRLTFYPGGYFQDDLDTQKIVPVLKFNWTALVAFTGIAKASGIDVGDWLAKKLHDIPMEARFEELETTLLTSNSWLSKLSGERRLAFSVVGFVGRRPISMIISNFLDMAGRTFPVSPLLISHKRKPKEPEVRIAGDVTSVSDADRQRLRQRLVASRKTSDVHTLIAEINALAAQRSKIISRECVTGQLLPTGAITYLPHGINTQGAYMPRFIMRSFAAKGIIGFNCKKDNAGNILLPQWVQSTGRVQGGRHKNDMRYLEAHEFRNALKPVVAGEEPDRTAFWRI